MKVLMAYKQSWVRRASVVPIFIAVRLFSLAIILPLSAAVVSGMIALSGQQALTDHDIAFFIMTPVGFFAFLSVSAIVLLGSVFGLAAMTVDIQGTHAPGVAAFRGAVLMIGARLRALFSFAVQIVLRSLAIVLPFALVALFIADQLIGAFDINYYLATKPREFYLAVGLIAALGAVMSVILVSRLLLWALTLHLVLFDDCSPRDAFKNSGRKMRGKRMALLRDLAVWFFLRVSLTVGIGLLFGGLLSYATAEFGSGFRFKLIVALIIVAIWLIAGLLVAAISLGSLAHVLNGFSGHPVASSALPTPTFTNRMLLVSSAALIILATVGGALLVRQVQADNTLQIIAHRGAAGSRPENTIAAIKQALEEGADWVEIDVQETSDGEIVVLHDSDFMKLAGVDLKIWDATADDLQDIDIGSWFDPLFKEERTPRLADVLEIVRDKAQLLIELKYYGHDEALEERTIALVENAGMVDQVATMSLSYPAVQKMKALRPDWRAGVLAATAIGDLAQLDGDFVAVNAAMVGPLLVRNVHQQGKLLFVWTVNDPLEMSAMMSLGVDGIITDEPALARETMKARAGLSTPERVFILFMDRFGLSPQ